jgi:hypothetical protein
MTSKTIVLRILDSITVVFLAILALSATGLPVEWLPRLFHMSLREFRPRTRPRRWRQARDR